MSNANEIIEYLTSAAERNEPLGPEEYLRAARSLVLFLGDEQNKLIESESKLAQLTLTLREADGDMTMGEINLRREASGPYKETRKQKAFVERIIEFIRIAKLHARITHEEMRHQGM